MDKPQRNTNITTPEPKFAPLCLWPGVIAVTMQWLVMFGLPLLVPEQGGTALIAVVIGTFAVVVWWVLFSRVPWSERLFAIALILAQWSRRHVCSRSPSRTG